MEMGNRAANEGRADFLVVGQGLAGSLLALELESGGAIATVVDSPLPYSSSKVAAGIINPITGKRLATSPDFGEYKDYASKRYRELEGILGTQFYRETRVLRILKDDKELAVYEKRNAEEAARLWLGELHPSGSFGSNLADPYGSFEILGAATLDTVKFLQATRSWLQAQGCLSQEVFRHEDLIPDRNHVSWGGRDYGCAIFCEGYRIRDNPWFRHCRMELAAGEIQTIRTMASLPQGILNAGKWLRPAGAAETYLAGSTYRWEGLESPPSQDGLEEMQQGLGKFLAAPYEVLDRQTGIRPVSKDRKPIMGRHPEHPCLAVLNGLGSKGSLLAPLLAHNLASHLQGVGRLMPGTEVSRFS
jgi:glycine oxidase